MISKHLLDPDFRPFVEQAPSHLTLASLPQRRALAAQYAFETTAVSHGERGGVSVTERFAPGPPGANDVRVLIYTPSGEAGPHPVLVHMHGGGMVMGSPENADARNRRLAAQVGCVVVSVDYRLAPEVVFPAPLEDCYAALKWVFDRGHEIGADPFRIALGGESAGGGLAASLALLARDRNAVPIVFQMLTYPMLDDRTGVTVPARPYAGQFMWSGVSNRFGWRAMLGYEPGGQGVPAYAAAARARELDRLPPTFIAVGALDLFVEENIEYANRLICAGVPTELHVYPGAPHGFDSVEDAQVSKACWSATAQALHRALHSGRGDSDSGSGAS